MALCSNPNCANEIKSFDYRAKYCSKKCNTAVWRMNNPERVKELRKKYRDSNPELHLERYHKWLNANREKARAASNNWKNNNPDKVREYVNNKYLENPDPVRARSAFRRAIMRGSTDNEFITTKSVIDRDGNQCRLCGSEVNTTLTGRNPIAPSIDHIIPLSRGGSHTFKNVQLAHFGCNSRKNNSMPSDKREVDIRAISLIANTFGVDEVELIEEAQNITALLKSGNE